MIVTRRFTQPKTANVFDALFNSFPSDFASANSSVAPVNISEDEQGYSLELNVPGRNKEDFKLDVENGLLTISYEKKEEAENQAHKFVRKEFTYSSFKRSFSLDEKINAEAIEAKYENGILRITLPKKEEVKNAPKQISIQ
jgi:HSP20 family protein